MEDYPNEKFEDYLDDDFYIYGMKCMNCGKVTRYIVSKDISHTNFRVAKEKFHNEPEFKECEYCGLITRQELITMTPSKDQIEYFKEVENER